MQNSLIIAPTLFVAFGHRKEERDYPASTGFFVVGSNGARGRMALPAIAPTQSTTAARLCHAINPFHRTPYATL